MVGSHQEDILEDILEDMLAEGNFGAMKELLVPHLQSILTRDFVFKFKLNVFGILRAGQKYFDKQKHGNTMNMNVNIYEITLRKS